MLNRKAAFGTIGGEHEYGAAFEQHGRLFDINGYEINKRNGQRLEGPDSPGWVPPQKPQAKQAPAPTAANLVDQLIALFGSREAALAALQAAAAVTPGPSTPPPDKMSAPTGLSLEAIKNPPPLEADPQGGVPDAGAEPSGDEAADTGDTAPADDDVIDEGINLSAWARGELPNIEFLKVKPLVKKLYDKTPVNAAMAVGIINRGLPE